MTLTMKWFSFPGILFLVNLTWYNELRLYRSKWSVPGPSLEVFYCYTKKGKRGWISMFQVFVSFKIAIDVSLKDSNNSFKGGIFQILFQLHSLHHFFFLIFIMKKIYTSRAYVKLKWRDIVFSLNKKIPVFEFSTLMWKDCTLYTVMIN